LEGFGNQKNWEMSGENAVREIVDVIGKI